MATNEKVSSPCMGILFSHHTHCYSLTQNNQGVSSPCMGILFSHSRPGIPHGVGSLWPFCGGDFQLIEILIIFTL